MDTKNTTIFDVIDNETAAYWLGFILADGYIYKNGKQLSVQLKQSDFEHLVRLQNAFGVANVTKGSSFDKRTLKHYDWARLVFCSKYTCDKLHQIGIENKKSLTVDGSVFSNVNDKVIHHFVRGYFDGDGSVSFVRNEPRITFVGTESFLDELASRLVTKTGIRRPKIYIQSNIHRFVIGGSNQVGGLVKWLYTDSTICLERKSKLCSKIKPPSIKGVDWDKQKNKWRARIMVDRKVKHLGFFVDKIDAVNAYNEFVLNNNMPKYKLNVGFDTATPEVISGFIRE